MMKMKIQIILGVSHMGTNDKMTDLIQRQREVLAQLEVECHALEGSDLVKENEKLKSELEKLRTDFETLNGSAAALSDENRGLKNALYEQIYNEKVKIVNTTAQKLDIYFKSSVEGELNRLTELEKKVKARINLLMSDLARNHIDTEDDIYEKLRDLSALLDSKLTEARAGAASTSGAFSPEEREELEALKNEQITGEQLLAVTKKNNWERFVGLNLLNRVGILLIIVGVITASQYTYLKLPDMLKGIMMFVLGGGMLVTGEFLNRKKSNIFSLGISAGGIAVLYVALTTSYFGLRILDMYPAIALCLLITVGAFVLSNRYNSQTIAAFALIGGYLPMFSIDGNITMVYAAMIYFGTLNLLALSVSFSKKWRIAAFIGLFLNIPGTFYICMNLHYNNLSTLEKTVTILYVTFAFLIYTLIPIVSTYRTKVKFRRSDIVLLGVNTFFSSLLMYGVFYSFDLEDYNGALAIIFAVTYLLLGRFIESKFKEDGQNTDVLFYLTGLAFVVLIIPFQFGRTWLSLGWLAEGVLLAAYGILNNERIFKRVGFIINLLCLCAFILFDCPWPENYLFAYKYLAITLGSLVILGAYIHKKALTGRFVRFYKYAAITNLWVYTLYVIGNLYDPLVKFYQKPVAYNIDYLLAAAVVAVTFLFAYTMSRIRILSDLGMKVMSIALYVIGVSALFGLNTLSSPINHGYLQTAESRLGITLVGTVVLVVMGLLSILAARDLLMLIVIGRRLGVEWYPLIISGYSLVLLTQNLITQFDLSFSSAVISIIYVLTALAWIVFGFMRRYSFIRRFGLGLAVLAVIKLFIIDLLSLTQGYRVVSYFALGITLVAISFVYQYFSKRLEVKINVEEDN